jgi:endonuclease/exonuclease/phosphatase family metal-dependent hydrolase
MLGIKRIFLLFLVLGIFIDGYAKFNQPLTVATYNLRQDNSGDGLNSWKYRKEHVKALIEFHDFDIFGTQEGFMNQLKDISELQKYSFTGQGRDGENAGEHSAIFYNKERLKLLDSGDFWLSQTPDKVSKGWDAVCCNRICSWGKFRDLDTKKEFYFFCVHFDHQGVEARRQSGILMVKKMKEIANDNLVICVGDFNSTPETEQINTMQTTLRDARKVSLQAPYGPEGTFNAFKFDADLNSRIDYIFVSSKIKVLKYGVLTDSYEKRYPSDHLPVLARIELN